MAAPAAPTPRPAAAPRAYVLAGPDTIITPEVEAQIEAAKAQVEKWKDYKFDSDAFREQMEAAREQVEQLRDFKFDFQFDPAINTNIDTAIAKAWSGIGSGFGKGFGGGLAFSPQVAPPAPPTPPAARAATAYVYNGNSANAYNNGQRALDDRNWENAVGYFNQVVNRNTTRVDGALYWKAYALAKLGRADDANAAIAELRKSHASSRYLDDAKALELQIKQAGGRPVSPEAEADDELKILAFNGLMQSDAEKFLPQLENILKGSGSPKLKRNALYVLAGSSSTKAQALLEQFAKGGGNPDLQVRAITYMTERRRGMSTNNGQILSDIYASTTDGEVKRAVLNALRSANDKDRLLAIARNEKTADLRNIALDQLGQVPGNPELWQLYAAETTTEGKEMILNRMYNNGSPDKLLEVLRTDKDAQVRARAARVLESYRTTQVADGLVAAYANEQDQKVKNAIVDAIAAQRNGKAMVDLAKAEKDMKLKMRLVERLSNMRNCKECSDYLMELLNK
jgi:hypothetical protein